MCFAEDDQWSTHSRRIDPISRSAKLFCQGEADARLVPDAHGAQSASDDRAVDWIPIADEERGASSRGNASMSWHEIH